MKLIRNLLKGLLIEEMIYLLKVKELRGINKCRLVLEVMNMIVN